MKEKPMRFWTAERRSRACNTLLVTGRTRAEAQANLDAGIAAVVGIRHYDIGPARIVREDRAILEVRQ